MDTYVLRIVSQEAVCWELSGAEEGKRVVPQVQRQSSHRRKQKTCLCLLNKKTVKREKAEGKKEEEEKREARI